MENKMNQNIKFLVQLIENGKVVKARSFFYKDIAISLQNKYSINFEWCTTRIIQFPSKWIKE